MQPQQMQQADAEQYRPIADSLSQDPKKALAMLIKMLIEQGVPPEEARKIAMEMIQAVAQGGMEEVSDDNRIEARFGGRMGYASGGIGRLVDREQYGFGSVFKSVGKAVSGAVKGVTSAVKSVASSKLGRIALTIAAGYYLGPMVSGFSSNPFVQGALRGGLANLAVQAASGQKINFGEALTSAALGGVTQGFTQGQTGEATKFAPDPFQEAALGNPTLANPTLANFSGETANGFGTNSIATNSSMVSNAPTSFGSGDTQFGFGGQDNIDISNAQGSFGQSLSKEIPLSQRYGNIKSAISGGNYMDALKQVSGAAIDNPLTTTLGLSSLAAASVPGQPEQLPGESMADYNARVEQWKTTLNANLGNTSGNPYLMPASANNPFYGVQAANGGRIGYQGGGIGNIISEATQEGFFSQPQMPMMAQGGRMGYAAGSIFKGLTKLAKEKAKQTKLTKQLDEAFDLAASRHDFDFSDYKMRNDIMAEELAEIKYGKNYDDLNLNTRLDLYDEAFDYLNDKAADYGDTMYDAFKERGGQANGGRMGYAYGNSVQDGIMAAPQIANQMGMPVGNPRQNQSGVSELDYRDQGGFVPPIGIKEKEDDIPAMLSNNEFVFTADAVKNAGGGDPNVGAQKMYAMMKQLENGGMA
jgi:hypothetical protein